MKDKIFWQNHENCRLATVEIIYRLPDHPSLLQEFIWQDYDYVPDWPRLQKFLHFWEQSLDGKLYAVNITSAKLLDRQEWCHVQSLLEIH